jgi:hypothetical protein
MGENMYKICAVLPWKVLQDQMLAMDEDKIKVDHEEVG